MDVGPVSSTEEALSTARRDRSAPGDDAAGKTPTHETPASERPDAGGIIATSAVEGGSTRDAAAERQTKDRLESEGSGPEDKLHEFAKQFAQEARLPTNVTLSIEIDSDTNQPRFLVRHRETGVVLREVPDPELREILDRVHDVDNLFLDRSL